MWVFQGSGNVAEIASFTLEPSRESGFHADSNVQRIRSSERRVALPGYVVPGCVEPLLICYPMYYLLLFNMYYLLCIIFIKYVEFII